jgi:hypothetical protein
VEAGAAKKAFDLKLPELGPYAIDFTRNGRYMLLGGTKGHLAMFDWQRSKLECEVQVGAGRRRAGGAAALGGRWQNYAGRPCTGICTQAAAEAHLASMSTPSHVAAALQLGALRAVHSLARYQASTA